MKAEKKLDKCDEQCFYNLQGICAFGLRDRIGCYLNPQVRKIAADIIVDAKTYNTKDIINTIINISKPKRIIKRRKIINATK